MITICNSSHGLGIYRYSMKEFSGLSVYTRYVHPGQGNACTHYGLYCVHTHYGCMLCNS
jgi:hypothetical protein